MIGAIARSRRAVAQQLYRLHLLFLARRTAYSLHGNYPPSRLSSWLCIALHPACPFARVTLLSLSRVAIWTGPAGHVVPGRPAHGVFFKKLAELLSVSACPCRLCYAKPSSSAVHLLLLNQVLYSCRVTEHRCCIGQSFSDSPTGPCARASSLRSPCLFLCGAMNASADT